jgi:hypothetical protein
MACPECGSEQGSLAQICPDCIERKKAARLIRHTVQRDQYRAVEVQDDIFHKISSNLVVQLLMLVALVPIAFGVFMFVGPVHHYGIMAVLLYSILMVAISFSALTYFWLWSKMIILQPFMAIIGILFPLTVWSWATMNREHAKSIVISHYFGVAIAIGALVSLSTTINKPLMDVLPMVYNFTKSIQEIEQSENQDRYNSSTYSYPSDEYQVYE